MKGIFLSSVLALAAWGQLRPAHPKKDSHSTPPPLSEVDAAVSDAQGRLVTGLAPGDFEILDGDNPQPVAAFAYVNTRPTSQGSGGAYVGSGDFPMPPVVLKPDQIRRTVALVVDDLSLSRSGIAKVREALASFIGTQMRDGDAAAIFRSSADGSGCARGITGDRRVLAAEAACVTYDYTRPSSPAAAAAGQSVALRAAMAWLTGFPGRKAVVLLTAAPGSADLKSLADDANEAGAVFYAIRVEGSGEGAAEQELAAATGGLAISAGAGEGLARVLDDQDGYYLLGFRPSGDVLQSLSPPRIVLKLKRAGLQLRYRSAPLASGAVEFGARNEDLGGFEPRQGSGLAQLEESANPLRLTALFNNSEAEGSYADVLLHLDGRVLVMTRDAQGIYHANLEILTAALGGGPFRERYFRTTINESWNETDYRRMRVQGVDILTQIKMPQPGGFQIVATVLDDTGGALGTARQFLEVPDLKRGLALSGIFLRKGDEHTPEAARTAPQSVEPAANPTNRRFAPGDSMLYALRICNLALNPQGASQIQLRVRVLRDDKAIYTGEPQTVSIAKNDTGNRRVAGGVVHLGNVPGKYLLEVSVTDLLAKPPAEAKQYIDYEVR